MEINEVLEIIRQNGIGLGFKIFFSSEDVDNDSDHMSIVNNYRYKRGEVKIYLDRSHLQKHEKNLSKTKECELLIKNSSDNRPYVIRVLCKYTKTDKRLIFARAYKVKFIDKNGRDASEMLRDNS